MDQFLQFKQYIEEVAASCRQRVQVIRKVASKNWGGDRRTLTKLYRATVLEKMLYGAPITSAGSNAVLQKLETIHNSGLRAICGAFHTSPISSIQAKVGIPSLRTLLDQRTAIFAARRLASVPDLEIPNDAETSAHENSSTDSNSSGELWNSIPVRPTATATARGKEILSSLQIQIPTLHRFILPTSAPWERIAPSVDKSLLQAVRNGATVAELVRTFLSRRATKYRHYSAVYTDGSKQASRCGYGVVCGDMVIRRRINGMCSIFDADSQAIKKALQWISHQRTGAYMICTDSLSAITALDRRKITSKWKDETVKLYKQITTQGTAVTFFWVPGHVGIHGNEREDREAKRSLQEQLTQEPLSFDDFKTIIKTRTLWTWNSTWLSTRSKMAEVKNSVLPYSEAFTAVRKEDVILARLRIGHIQITHCYLLERKEPPHCTMCDAPLSVKHILTECQGLETERRHAGLTNSIRESLADDINRAQKVLKFLKNIKLFNCI
ncbi:uncharacterized protein LOC131688260 [Topomyia yanbarensis]|uniref:uncharacterized protein LOC131688260 n=1 Tax=Topomyia yanbarensis TaxID=2498891 RepID=UPI00273B80F5|nr:uncharacterized protein LOC131688260 [Topomyia yanbarensis]